MLSKGVKYLGVGEVLQWGAVQSGFGSVPCSLALVVDESESLSEARSGVLGDGY